MRSFQEQLASFLASTEDDDGDFAANLMSLFEDMLQRRTSEQSQGIRSTALSESVTPSNRAREQREPLMY